jgi:hypothetical protein
MVVVRLVVKTVASVVMKHHVLTVRVVYAPRVVVRMAFVDLGKIVMRAVHVPTDAVRKGMLDGTAALESTV